MTCEDRELRISSALLEQFALKVLECGPFLRVYWNLIYLAHSQPWLLLPCQVMSAPLSPDPSLLRDEGAYGRYKKRDVKQLEIGRVSTWGESVPGNGQCSTVKPTYVCRALFVPLIKEASLICWMICRAHTSLPCRTKHSAQNHSQFLKCWLMRMMLTCNQ